MTRLSVNINKIGTLRNSRGGTMPSVLEAAIRCQQFGAEGITIHPRPDERHIKRSDVYELKPVITSEFNIEGCPTPEFLALVTDVLPNQVTLVPDSPEALTSHQGWNAIRHKSFLRDVIAQLKSYNIRTSVFVETDLDNIEVVKLIGADRIELYTEPYALAFKENRESAIAPFIKAAQKAKEVGLGLNAGHDLNLDNLNYFSEHIVGLMEVSIGHALIADALYLGMEKTIHLYLDQLKKCS